MVKKMKGKKIRNEKMKVLNFQVKFGVSLDYRRYSVCPIRLAAGPCGAVCND